MGFVGGLLIYVGLWLLWVCFCGFSCYELRLLLVQVFRFIMVLFHVFPVILRWWCEVVWFGLVWLLRCIWVDCDNSVE